MNARQRKKRARGGFYEGTRAEADWIDVYNATYDEMFPVGACFIGPRWREARSVANKRIGGFGVWAARERRARTAMRHLERRRQRWRRVRPRPRGDRDILGRDAKTGRPVLLSAATLMAMQIHTFLCRGAR